MTTKTILFIEAFYGGSHKQLIDLLFREFSDSAEMFTMPAKKWHWRSLTSCLYFADAIPKIHNFRILFTSSVLPLADLIAIRPDLAKLKKIVYFHENQMVYPVRTVKDRYFQHGYNQVLTCLSADQIIFNSHFNKESFLQSLKTYFSIMPDFKPKNLRIQIEPKSSVLYYSVDLPTKNIQSYTKESNTEEPLTAASKIQEDERPLHIVWPHRWEHDKNPEEFFSVLFKLKENGFSFKVSVIGETFTEQPTIFRRAAEQLKDNIVHWGYQESKEEYFSILESADVVVSTANHEFFGVSMLEAVSCGCYPLCPNKLAYPEIYPEVHLYNTSTQLLKKLKYFCKKPAAIRNFKVQVDVMKFSWKYLRNSYRKLFDV